jgi:serine/threonine protein kinase
MRVKEKKNIDATDCEVREPFFSVFEGTSVERPGTQVGRYKLLSVLGEGGYGIVYLAEQERPMRRRVALKIIKPGMDSKEVLARFESERQALALMDHPGIARVFDAGATDAGRPYFVMEYVNGLPITDFCDRQRLSIEERLRLFQQACAAVQHAHHKGIIHRDLKPSNTLVSLRDDKPVCKIIDFGVARATSQPLTERTLYTERGQLVGTPEYMSPEQANMSFGEIDTRSDVYSLGAVLYELLTGTLPFDPKTLRQKGAEGMRKIIREQEPFTPSVQFSSLGDSAREIAAQRNTEATALGKQLHGELEWIPLKAMRKDRTRRYQCAAELAQDVENYLEGAALLAGPESIFYQIKKFSCKHRRKVFAGATVVCSMLAGFLMSTMLYGDMAQTPANDAGFESILFADAQLQVAVESALGIVAPRPVDMLNLVKLQAGELGITNLSGLEYAKNLEWLELHNNKICDLTPLAGLTKLSFLALNDNRISDISVLSGMKDLVWLWLYDSQITDVSPLLAQRKLQRLDLHGTPLNAQAYARHIPRIRTNNPDLKRFTYNTQTVSNDPHVSDMPVLVHQSSSSP